MGLARQGELCSDVMLTGAGTRAGRRFLTAGMAKVWKKLSFGRSAGAAFEDLRLFRRSISSSLWCLRANRTPKGSLPSHRERRAQPAPQLPLSAVSWSWRQDSRPGEPEVSSGMGEPSSQCLLKREAE